MSASTSSSAETRLDQIYRPVPRTGVIYVMTEAAKRGFTYGAPGWANLGQGAPETGALPGAAPRLEAIAIDAQSAEYAPVPGLWELREAVASLYNRRYRRGMPSQYSAENVAIAAGGRLALTRVATALGPIHLGHLLPDYTAYEELLAAFRRFVPIPIVLRADQGFRLTPRRFEDVAVGTGLGALLLSNPSNPTGQLIADGDLGAMVGTARRFGCSLIVDEFYAHYTYERDHPVSAAAFVEDVEKDPVVVLDGLTKNWRYPGLRLSWTVAPKAVIDRVASAGSFLDGGPMHAAQIAALPLLDADLADTEARAIRSHFAAKRDRMIEQLGAMGIRVPAAPMGAFYCFADLAELPQSLRSGMAFFRAALDEQVVTVPGEFFDVDPGKRRQHLPSRLERFVRLSFGPASEELERGLAGLERVIAAAS